MVNSLQNKNGTDLPIITVKTSKGFLMLLRELKYI
jgi:hypothetical protein